MVHLESVNKMNLNWKRNRDFFLSKHSDGYVVIDSVRCTHYNTLEEVYQANPLIGQVYRDKKIILGTIPLLIDVRAEIESEEKKSRERKSSLEVLNTVLGPIRGN